MSIVYLYEYIEQYIGLFMGEVKNGVVKFTDVRPVVGNKARFPEEFEIIEKEIAKVSEERCLELSKYLTEYAGAGNHPKVWFDTLPACMYFFDEVVNAEGYDSWHNRFHDVQVMIDECVNLSSDTNVPRWLELLFSLMLDTYNEEDYKNTFSDCSDEEEDEYIKVMDRVRSVVNLYNVWS